MNHCTGSIYIYMNFIFHTVYLNKQIKSKKNGTGCTNLYHILRGHLGGYLIRRAYELAALAAEIVAPDRVVPFQVNRINFNQPVLLGDQLKFIARVVYTGRTTVTVQSDIERFNRTDGAKALSNSCLFTFRNVGSDMEPKPVSFIYPVTYAEDARFLNAYRQRVD